MNLSMERIFNVAESIDKKNTPKREIYLKKIFSKLPMLVNNNLESKVLEYKAREYLRTLLLHLTAGNWRLSANPAKLKPSWN